MSIVTATPAPAVRALCPHAWCVSHDRFHEDGQLVVIHRSATAAMPVAAHPCGQSREVTLTVDVEALDAYSDGGATAGVPMVRVGAGWEDLIAPDQADQLAALVASAARAARGGEAR